MTEGLGSPRMQYKNGADTVGVGPKTKGKTMKARILVSLAVAGLATAANAQSTQASGASLAQAGVSVSGVAAQLFNDAKSSVVATYDATIAPTADLASKTYEVSIAPVASAVGQSTTKAAKHVRIYYVQPTLDTSSASVDASLETGASVYNKVLIPVGNATVDSANSVSEGIELVAVSAWDFSKEVGVATANGAQLSFNEVLVPLALVTRDAAVNGVELSVDASAQIGDLSVQWVLMPTADAAKIVANAASATGAVTNDATSGSIEATGNFSGNMSQVSGNASGGISGVSRASVSTDAKKRRAEQRSQAEKALRGNK